MQSTKTECFLIWVFAAAAILFFLIFVFLFLMWSGKGFEITDESYYLANIAYPLDYIVATSSFGRYLYNVQIIIGNTIEGLRIFGLFGLCVAGLYLGNSVLDYLPKSQRFELPLKIFYLVFFTSSSLAYYRIWLVTPSYNWFALIGILIVAGAILKLSRPENANAATGIGLQVWLHSILLGVGGALLMAGRYPAAFLVGVVLVIWMLVFYPTQHTMRVVFIAVASFLLLFLVHVAVNRFDIGLMWESFLFAIEWRSALKSHSMLKVVFDPFLAVFKVLEKLFNLTTLAGIAVFALSTVICFLRRSHVTSDAPRLWCYSVMTGAITLIAANMVEHMNTIKTSRLPSAVAADLFLFLNVVLLGRIVLIAKGWQLVLTEVGINNSAYEDDAEAKVYPIIFLCVVLAILASTGTNTDLFVTSSYAYGLWSVSVILLLPLASPGLSVIGRLLIVASLGLALAQVLAIASFKPYRIVKPIWQQTIQITLWTREMSLYVDEPTAKWVRDLQAIAAKEGWQRGTPFLDLTGGTPGAALVLDGRPPLTPWNAGARFYNGEDGLKVILGRTKEHIRRRAWLLTAFNGKRRIDDTVLREFGLDFPRYYVKVGEVVTSHRNETQVLWRPK